MGCFSYICQKCDTPINSTSFTGELVKLFLLKKGKVVERMTGEYDSYGRVFGGREWKTDWHSIVALHFSDDDTSGIAAIHRRCWDGKLPTVKSANDPNQGWGEVRKKYQIK